VIFRISESCNYFGSSAAESKPCAITGFWFEVTYALQHVVVVEISPHMARNKVLVHPALGKAGSESLRFETKAGWNQPLAGDGPLRHFPFHHFPSPNPNPNP